MDLECHITIRCALHRIDFLRAYIEESGWSFSRIAGDPLLGDYIFCYATSHFTSEIQSHKETHDVSLLLQSAGFDVLRRKIERVILDQRYQNNIWNSIL